MTDVAFAIDYFAESMTLNRQSGAGSYSENGFWEDSSEVTITIEAVIQPIKTNDLLRLPEGERTDASHVVWSRHELRTSDETNGIGADVIEWQGRSFKVISLFERPEGGYYKAVCSLKNVRSRNV